MKYKRFRAADGRFQVELEKQVLPQIEKHVKAAGEYETGGILIGNYDERHECAMVASATKAPRDSKGGYTWFNRGVVGLQRLLNIYWNKKRYYLGEWHFHPKASADASGRDEEQMLSISKNPKYRCPEPVMLIIGGNAEVYEIKVYIAVKGKEFLKLLPVINADK